MTEQASPPADRLAAALGAIGVAGNVAASSSSGR